MPANSTTNKGKLSTKPKKTEKPIIQQPKLQLHRINSTDSAKSSTSTKYVSSVTLNSSDESELLRSDDEGPIQKINLLPENLEQNAILPRTNDLITIMETDEKDDSVPITTPANQQISAEAEIMSLLRDIKDSHCTKGDLSDLKLSLDSKFAAVNTELNAHKDKHNDLETRLLSLESKMSSSNYERELSKQKQLKNHVNIFGFPKTDGEDLKETALTIFKAFGCNISKSDFDSVYRTNGRAPKFSSIVVKFKDFEKKLNVLNSKKQIRLKDVAECSESQQNIGIYINNHTTPYFGRIMAAGRKAAKEKIIHSCWMVANSCLIQLKENGKPIAIRNVETLDEIVKKELAAGTRKRARSDDPSSPVENNSKK